MLINTPSPQPNAPENVLAHVKKLYEDAKQHAAYTKWRDEAKLAWAFYDGDQWTPAEKEVFAERGQLPVVINKIAAKVDNIAGTEIAGRTRLTYRSRSGLAQEEETARALSDLALYVAERNDQALEISSAFKSALVCGVGFLDVGVEDALDAPFIFNRAEDALSVVWDHQARQDDFSDARFIARERWMTLDAVQAAFGEKAEALLTDMTSPKALHCYAPLDIRYANHTGDLVRVVEVQYTQTAPLYVVRQADGTTSSTFEKKAAKAMAQAAGHAENAGETAYEKRFVPRVHVAYFSDSHLLQHTPQPHGHNQFSLVPVVFKRDKTDGRPYGMVRAAMDPQREFNKRRSKAMHLLNTAQVIADVDAVDDPAILAREAARPDGMILKRPGKDIRILRNSDLAQSQVAVMNQANTDIQDALGVYDEAVGRQSNATSGIAIAQRQQASTLNQMFAFDQLRKAKKKLGLHILSLMRDTFTHEMVIQLTDDFNAAKAVHLNTPILAPNGKPLKDAQGNILKKNDVRLGTFDVHVEEVKDALSGRELELQQLQLLQQAGIPIPPQVLIEATNIKQKEAVLAGLAQAAEASTD